MSARENQEVGFILSLEDEREEQVDHSSLHGGFIPSPPPPPLASAKGY